MLFLYTQLMHSNDTRLTISSFQTLDRTQTNLISKAIIFENIQVSNNLYQQIIYLVPIQINKD